eukprot:TRINITY_DN42344_c0_g1_i1.p1 TRINITY_DN42344_c0_g1~~TRINITY_DN42344_c0_g1_i1.p1  ORF type:complete len:1140 (+),score=179.59 TRINITY_DN42344_c0_g1_i1:61-3480(+)
MGVWECTKCYEDNVAESETCEWCDTARDEADAARIEERRLRDSEAVAADDDQKAAAAEGDAKSLFHDCSAPSLEVDSCGAKFPNLEMLGSAAEEDLTDIRSSETESCVHVFQDERGAARSPELEVSRPAANDEAGNIISADKSEPFGVNIQEEEALDDVGTSTDAASSSKSVPEDLSFIDEVTSASDLPAEHHDDITDGSSALHAVEAKSEGQHDIIGDASLIHQDPASFPVAATDQISVASAECAPDLLASQPGPTATDKQLCDRFCESIVCEAQGTDRAGTSSDAKAPVIAEPTENAVADLSCSDTVPAGSLSDADTTTKDRADADVPKDAPTEIWEVHGGSHPDGLLVRTSEELSSHLLPNRLARGSRVKQLQLRGIRLHFERISGDGPEEGWVSLKSSGKDLLRKIEVLAPQESKLPVMENKQEILPAEEHSSESSLVKTTAEGERERLPGDSSLVKPISDTGASETIDVVIDTWEVSGGSNADGLLVRTGHKLNSPLELERLTIGSRVRQLELQGGRLHFERISGKGPDSGWVSIAAAGKELMKRIIVPPPPSPDDHLLYSDYLCRPRGACKKCRDCNAWVFKDFSRIEWDIETARTDDERNYSYNLERRGQRDRLNGFEACCQSCNCLAEDHLDLSGWVDQVCKAAKPFRETVEEAYSKDAAYRHMIMAGPKIHKKRTLPRHSTMPLASLRWSYVDCALYILSYGIFDPRRHGRGDSATACDSKGNLLMSAICPTSEKRHAFHPLLYENFRTQTHEPKELIVIDTGARPSAFLMEKARTDARVIYRHFVVEDSRETDPMQACILEDGRSTAADIKKRRGMTFRPRIGWSLGFKRNLCCYLSRGAIIAHFDDDDLYAPSYLSRMNEQIKMALQSKNVNFPAGAGGLKPAAATLSEWHMMDVKDQRFGFFDPKTDPLLENQMREPFQYGYGFSFVYTRSAWDVVPFPDTEFSEDGDFMGRLQLKKIPIKLVRSRDDALAAHTHHSDSTSGGELVGHVRLGYAVACPEGFRALLPVAEKVGKDARVQSGASHGIREEMHRVLNQGQAPAEIRWHEKDHFLRLNPGFGRPVQQPDYRDQQQQRFGGGGGGFGGGLRGGFGGGNRGGIAGGIGGGFGNGFGGGGARAQPIRTPWQRGF